MGIFRKMKEKKKNKMLTENKKQIMQLAKEHQRQIKAKKSNFKMSNERLKKELEKCLF
jgi:maltodextrin utilization protein YvdJ